MKKIILLLYIFLFSCRSKESERPLQDSAVRVQDAVIQGDTDDHNKPSPEAVPLDAPPGSFPSDSVKSRQ